MTAFVDDPVATHSGQFPLARPSGTATSAEPPSPSGVRPWGLRHLDEGTPDGLIDTSGWKYDPIRQLTVDRDGAPTVMASAKSVSNNDGDEGPSEDWQYDYCPDEPFEV